VTLSVGEKFQMFWRIICAFIFTVMQFSIADEGVEVHGNTGTCPVTQHHILAILCENLRSCIWHQHQCGCLCHTEQSSWSSTMFIVIFNVQLHSPPSVVRGLSKRH
jgi:hypothetical protein